MIEPTDEMVEAFRAVEGTGGWGRNDPREAIRAGLAAVLAIVERDRCMEAAGHAYQPPAQRRCDAKDGTFFCELTADHGGSHTASLGAGLGMSWS